ncbi:hypothetical protein [Heyndrickxia coagulans]|uniref:Uncharacterized protein n=1 Tax=Heyndrickxia coagulans DSM 1 = ATCC 7050 TaxID=1121088 RepID=A0A0B5X0S2_HEYCO|nr:hypothetical protein [Heyndrickxia coagulans]AJH77543.1 hypothetical protein BF29_2589 [Heyndrickxia coagulans DSM 1 = ATCC 7050]AJH79824.1 hypothetical protein BF29_2513 [Heyndrickxia coagulans DSM 1 = ATCC 7050]MCR2847335.1 hypothetical protein [Heyndrickxia coagulans]MED4492953.1 hypothetical protein [Heyndrickxia coagulans]MED4535158.1 hypothetical protein [Heyndrickxia coagulans]
MKPKVRKKGEKFRPIVTVLKVKRGLPTKIMVSGQEYALIHKNQYKG